MFPSCKCTYNCTYEIVFKALKGVPTSEFAMSFYHYYKNSCSNHHLHPHLHHVYRFAKKKKKSKIPEAHINTSIHKCSVCFLAKLIMPVKWITTDSMNLHHWNIGPLNKFSGSRTEASEKPRIPLRTTDTVKLVLHLCVWWGSMKKIYLSRAMSLTDVNIFFPTG